MLHYDHGAEWQMFFMCPMPHGKTGIFLYTMPYVLTANADCSYSMPSQASTYPMQLFNVPQFSEAFLVHDRICCIICTLYVSTVYRLLRLFLGMNRPLYTFHEHRNTKQAEESHCHSYWLLQVSQRRYFVCNLKQSVNKTFGKRCYHRTHVDIGSMFRRQVFVHKSQFRPSSGIKISDVIRNLSFDCRIWREEFNVSDG